MGIQQCSRNMLTKQHVLLLISTAFLVRSTGVSGQVCEKGLSLSSAYLDRLKDTQVNNFAPSVYYEGKSTKFISPYESILEHEWLCVDGAANNSGAIQLYDDGTNGDDFAGDGIYTRDCVHYCSSSVDFSDYFGFAMQAYIGNPNGASLTVMDASKEGTVPYDVITTDLTPNGKVIASSHAFFFADTGGTYYPKFPTSVAPNSAAEPSAKNVAVSALMQVFGDVFDYVTVTPMERPNVGGIQGAGIYKWQTWDRRGGPQYDRDIGDPEKCISAVAGIPIQRLSGLITCGDVISGRGIEGEMHELVHGVSGFEYHRALEAARTGDGMHVPGACTVDHSSLQGPLWDWVIGYPERIPDSTDNGGVHLVENNDCASCSIDDLPNCCSFHYVDMPSTRAAMIENPELVGISPLMLYIAGMIKASQIAPADKTYYCMGSDTDGGCGNRNQPEQTPCVNKVDDSNRSRVTSDFVSRFTFKQLVNAVGGKRYPAKKFNVVRHAAVHLSAREPTESEITFYTLLWRQHEIQKTPWKRIPEKNTSVERYPIDTWYFHTRGNSILHSRLHGIDCGDNSEAVPSCSTSSSVCAGAPCGPGAVCKNLDGQPLCICRDGLVGDGYECAFPSETGFGRLPTAHESGSECFPTASRWTNFVDEASLPPYPGGQMPYASTTCHNHGICPADWQCNKEEGCLPPTGGSICQQKGFERGQCEALGCCKWNPGLSGDKCVKQSDGVCNKPLDPNIDIAKCDDQETCCYFSCNDLELQHSGNQYGQRGNCGKDCTIGISPAYDGKVYPELYFFPTGGYHTNHEQYKYGEGPLNIQGANKNMFERCSNTCDGSSDESTFLKNLRPKDGVLIKKTCGWLRSRKTKQKRKICTNHKFSLATQGYKPARDVCTAICAAYM